MGAFQRLPKGRPWGGFHSPWRCWACRPCWARWCRPSITSTTATQPRSCRSSLRTRRQAWWWKRWFTMVPTATAGFRKRFFHPLRLPRHRQMQEPQPPQQPLQPLQLPQPRTQQQNIHHRHHPHPHLLLPHPRQQQQQQRAQEEEEEEEQQRQTQRPEEEQALQTKSEPPQSSGRRRQQDRVQYFWMPPILTKLSLPPDHMPELKTSPSSNAGAQDRLTHFCLDIFLFQGHHFSPFEKDPGKNLPSKF